MPAARRRLALVWFGGGGACFVVLLFISLFARGVDVPALWDWFLPAIVPNLSLIIGVMVYAQRQPAAHEQRADGFLFHLALGISLLYVLLLLLPLVFFPLTGKPLPELLALSRLWLAAVQGLATGAMGAFFVRPEK